VFEKDARHIYRVAALDELPWLVHGFGTRQADIPWLIREFEKHGLKLRRRRAGQFTEMFILLPWKPLRSLVHAANNLWFRMGGAGGPAFGNLLVFERPA